MYPLTAFGQVVGAGVAVLGVVVLSLPITVIGTTFTEEYEEQQRISERERRAQARIDPASLITLWQLRPRPSKNAFAC